MPVRIYEIAKKLGCESREVLAIAHQLGIDARVPSSALNKDTADYLEQQVKANVQLSKKSLLRPPATSVPANPTPSTTAQATSAPAARSKSVPASPWEVLTHLQLQPDHAQASANADRAFQKGIDNKHPTSIAVVNYKGGVGKTTATFFLGAQVANDHPKKKILIIDIDAQCSLTSVFGIDPTLTDDHNVLTLLTGGKAIKPSSIHRDAFIRKGKYGGFPPNLFLLPGALEVEDLDFDLAREKRFSHAEFFLQCRRVLALFHDFDYIFVDCPPNKMLLTQGMLRACSCYLPVVIPDRVSAYGIPRLLRWIEDVPLAVRPRLIGVLINRVIRNPSGITDVQHKSLVAIRATVAKHKPLFHPERGILGQWPNSNKVCEVYDEGKSHLGHHDIWETKSRQAAVGDCVKEASDNLISVFK